MMLLQALASVERLGRLLSRLEELWQYGKAMTSWGTCPVCEAGCSLRSRGSDGGLTVPSSHLPKADLLTFSFHRLGPLGN